MQRKKLYLSSVRKVNTFFHSSCFPFPVISPNGHFVVSRGAGIFIIPELNWKPSSNPRLIFWWIFNCGKNRISLRPHSREDLRKKSSEQTSRYFPLFLRPNLLSSSQLEAVKSNLDLVTCWEFSALVSAEINSCPAGCSRLLELQGKLFKINLFLFH